MGLRKKDMKVLAWFLTVTMASSGFLAAVGIERSNYRIDTASGIASVISEEQSSAGDDLLYTGYTASSETEFNSDRTNNPEESPEKTAEEQRETLLRDEGLYSPNSIVLQNTTKAEAERIAEMLGAKVRITPQEDYAVLYLPEGMSIDDVFANEELEAYVSRMTPDYFISTGSLQMSALNELDTDTEIDNTSPRLSVTKNRPSYTGNDPYYSSQNYLEYLDIQDTWNQTKGSGITIAVIDSGIDIDHPEFEGKISEYSYYASQDKVVKDYDMSVIDDEQGHGTGVAGVIAAAMNNSEGITGIAPDVNLLVIKCDVDSTGELVRGSDAVLGLAYAIEQDVDIINMSFRSYEDVFSKYTKLAADSDIICIASAGNDGSSIPVYPASLDSVIGVGAYDTENDTITDYSNYGDNVDILAPGTAFTTSNDGTYTTATGTSISCPIATAAAALYMAKNGKVTYEKMRQLFQASCIDVGILGEDYRHGYGELDIHALVCEEKGTITYDMMTDELPNETQIFVRGRTVQYMPEPERNYEVYDGWFFDPNCTAECELYTNIFNEDVTLYANWINEDEGTVFSYVIKDDNTIDIRSYTGKRRFVTVPEEIEGKKVTSIGEDAFGNNTRMRSVELPKTLKMIGDRAFSGCTALRGIDLPDSVTVIGEQAFSECSRLAEISIGSNSNLAEVRTRAFENSGLSSFYVPAKLTVLGEYPFYGSTGLRSVTVAGSNTAFQVKNNALYNKAGTVLMYYPSALTGSYTVDAGTTSIGTAAFAYSKIGQINLNNGIVSIGKDGFAYSRIGSLSLPASLETLEDSAFAYTSRLQSVDFADAGALSVIGEKSFLCTYVLKEINIPGYITIIGESAFSFSGLTNVAFAKDGALALIGVSSFAGTSIKKVEIPDSVEVIEGCAFNNCWQLSEVKFDANSHCTSILHTAFACDSNLKNISLPDSVNSLGDQTFYQSGLTTVSIGAGLTELGKGVFANCKSLSSISVNSNNPIYASYDGVLYDKNKTSLLLYPAGKSGTYALPASVTRIDNFAFSGADKLTSVSLNEGLTEIGENAFEYCSGLQTPVLPSTLKEIERCSFMYCEGMTASLLIPKVTQHIGLFAFYYDYNLTDIDFESESEIDRFGYGAFGYCGIEDFTVPRNVSTMGQEVFTGSNKLLTVTFESESQMTYIPAWTFRGADNLRRITFEGDSELTHIEARGCESLAKLETVDFSGCSKLMDIDNYAFRMCVSLTEMDLPESLERIGRYAFYGCASLSELHLPESIDTIGSYAFAKTHSINLYFASPVLPENLEENWDTGVAAYYVGVNQVQETDDWSYAVTSSGKASIIKYKGSAENVVVDKIEGYEVVSIGGEAFLDNTALRSITLPDTVSGIYKAAFKGTSNLKSITIPANVSVIESEAFYGSGIESITFAAGSKLSSIGTSAFENTAKLAAVTIPNSVKQIREKTFYESGIRSITLSDSITEIGRFSFAESKLESVSIPASVRDIAYHAFQNTDALEGVTFASESAKAALATSDSEAGKLMIRDEAFYHSGLKTVSIPAYVNYIGNLVFSNCHALTDISVSGENSFYASLNGVLYDKALKKLITCPAGKTGSYTVSSNVETFAFGAFEGSQLTVITIPEQSNLITIGYRAFYDCDNLTTINIPDSVQSIEYYAFANCDNLEKVTINSTSRLGGIYSGAFYNCSKLSSIVISDGVLEISDYAFYGCSALKDVSLSGTSKLQGIYDHAFEYAGIEEFEMPDEMLELGAYAFHGTDLRSFTFNSMITDIGEYALADSHLYDVKSLVVPDSVEYIGRGFLKNIVTVESLELPFLGQERSLNLNVDASKRTASLGYIFSEVVNQSWIGGEDLVLKELTINGGNFIDSFAFFNLNTVESISLANSIEYIGDAAFMNCEALNHVQMPDNVSEIKFQTFYDCKNLTEIDLPDGLVLIDSEAFYGCSSLESIAIPDKTVIKEGAFGKCSSLNEIVVSGKGNYIWKDGALYTKDMKLLVFVARNYAGEFSVPETVERIGNGAFSCCDSITKISMGDSVESIGTGAFSNCTKLEQCELSNNLRIIESDAFELDSSLTTIELPDSLEEIEQGAFYQCRSLEEIIIPEKVTKIDWNTFGCCEKLAHITFEGAITEICTGAFRLSGLISIEIPDTTETIGDSVFSSCLDLEYVYLPKGIRHIGNDCFNNCPSLQMIEMEENDYFEIKDGTLFDKANGRVLATFASDELKTIYVPEGTVEIGDMAYQCNETVERIVLPESVKRIGDAAFNGCTNLKEVVFGDSIESFGTDILLGTPIADNPDNYSNGVLYVDNYALQYNEFYAYDNKNIRIKNGTKLLCDELFSMAKGIESVSLPDSLKYIGYAAFSQCNSIRLINIPESVDRIGDLAFCGCTGLTGITLSDVELGQTPFVDCINLRYVIYSGKGSGIDELFDGSGINKLVTLDVNNTEGGEWSIPSTGNLILDGICGDIVYMANPDTRVFLETDERINFTAVPSENVYIRNEWNKATFIVDQMPISIVPYLKNEVINTPADSVVETYLEEGNSFIGWDINGDGMADELPATLNEDIVAVAVCDISVNSIVLSFEAAHYTTDGSGNQVIDYRYYNLYEGKSKTIQANIFPESYNHNAELVWSSSDETRLKVDQNGTITALLYDGSDEDVIVRASLASDPSIYGEVHVSILPRIYGISLDETSAEVKAGSTYAIEYTIEIPDGYAGEVTFVSQNDNIATVDGTGVITGIEPGYTDITIRCGDEYSAVFSVHVIKGMTDVYLEQTEGELNVGSTMKLTPTFVPEDTTESRTVKWHSNNTKIAKVSSDGTITGVAPGVTEIVGEIGDHTLTFTVTVKAPLERITLNTTKGTLRLDHTKQLSVIYIPNNTTDSKAVVWSSENPEIATVDDTGLVTGLQTGRTVITATVGSGTDNELSATYTVSVIGLRDEATGITVTNSDDTEMEDGTSLEVDEVDEETAQQQYGNYRQSIILLIKDKHGRVYIMYIYDISLYRNNASVQPDGSVDVEIPFPSGLLKGGGYVYHLGTDGSLTDMQATYRNGHFFFTTNHFSAFCLVVPVESTGWFEQDGKKYYLDENGEILTGAQTIDGKLYYFDEEGVMQTGWLELNGKKFYLDSDGVCQTGAVKIEGKWYYFSKKGVMQTGFADIGGNRYYLNEDGVMQTGAVKVDGKVYYFNKKGIMQTGPIVLKKNVYYLDPETGAMHTGWLTLGKKKYYFDQKGRMCKGAKVIDGLTYYFNSDGTQKTGVYKTKSGVFYLDPDNNGAMHTGWLDYKGSKYYFTASGKMVTGPKKIDVETYYFDKKSGKMQTGVLKLAGKYYYMNEDGTMHTGWLNLKGKTYYLQEDGSLAMGCTLTIAGKKYNFNSKGVCTNY